VPGSNPDTPNPDAPTLQGVAANITSLPSIEDILTALGRNFTDKKVDILVLNAAHNTRPKLGHASEADITNSLTANLQWPIVLVENLVRRKLFNNNSRLVLLSSDRVRDPSPGSSIFNATKAGLESLARSWALELPLTFPGTTVSHFQGEREIRSDFGPLLIFVSNLGKCCISRVDGYSGAEDLPGCRD
jgi:3-oxoacyl-[acyl-carrier protein] reductase